jgi:hypothetical protein
MRCGSPWIAGRPRTPADRPKASADGPSDPPRGLRHDGRRSSRYPPGMSSPDDPASAPAPGPGSGWICATCGSARPASDLFCGVCGAASRPASATRSLGKDPTPPARPATSPLLRSVALGAVLLISVFVAVLVGGGKAQGPGAVTFEPTAWRCDGSERTWTATLPASAPELVLELRDGGTGGRVVVATPTSRDLLAPWRQADGTFRVSSTDPAAPECAQPAGRYGLVIRDTGTGSVVASGEVSIER